MANQKNPNQQGPNKPESQPDFERQRQNQTKPGGGDHERNPMNQPGQRRDQGGKGDMGKGITNPDEVDQDDLDDDRITQRNPKQDQQPPKPTK